MRYTFNQSMLDSAKDFFKENPKARNVHVIPPSYECNILGVTPTTFTRTLLKQAQAYFDKSGQSIATVTLP